MTALVSLPTELLSSILYYLEYRDVLRCRQVCAGLKDVVDRDVRIQYKIELAVAGMEDGNYSTLTASERLAVLRERQDAWKTLTWRSEEDTPASKNCSLWELYGGVFARDEGRRTLHFTQLPSHIRRIEKREWTLDDVGMSMTDFGMDPAQDLLVVLEAQEDLCHIHLKSMTTGHPHPMASSTTLVHKPECDLVNAPYSIQTSNDHLALLITGLNSEELRSELVIWNWKSGTLILNVLGVISSFVFLTPVHVVFLTHRNCGLNDGIVRTYTSDPCMVVLALDTAQPNTEPVQMANIEYLCAFTYPDLNQRYDVVQMLLRADPGPGWVSSPSLAVPFSVARNDRLLVVTLEVMHGIYDVSTLLSLIPSSTILSAVKSLQPGETRRTFTWEEWGPKGSRFLSPHSRFSGVDMPCYVFGTCFAMHRQLRRAFPASLTITHYDFNPRACRRMLALGEDNNGKAELVTTPTTLAGRAKRSFEGEVTTSCPYIRREVVVTGKEDEGQVVFDELLLGEDSLILVSSEEVNSEPFFRVLTF